MKNKILVTGATGNIGRELVKQLKAEQANFIAGTTSGDAIDGVETIKLDFADKGSLEEVMQGVSTLFMLLPSHSQAVAWGETIIDVAKSSGVNHIVRTSGLFADADSDLLIENLLGTTDEYLKASGINYTITAPSSFMQNFATMMAADYKAGVIYQSAGEGQISWVDVRDVAAVNTAVLLNTEQYLNETVLITGSERLNYAEAIQQMNEVLGKETTYVAIPHETAVQAMADMHFPQFIIDLLISLNESIRQGHFVEITDAVERVTGTAPITFKQFVMNHKAVWL